MSDPATLPALPCEADYARRDRPLGSMLREFPALLQRANELEHQLSAEIAKTRHLETKLAKLEVERSRDKRALTSTESDLKRSRDWASAENDRANELRDIVATIIDSEPPCDHCAGTGGEPDYEDTYCSGQWSIEDRVLIDYGDPHSTPCEDGCLGTGFEIPNAEGLLCYALGHGGSK